jgi:hypothetical protein
MRRGERDQSNPQEGLLSSFRMLLFVTLMMKCNGERSTIDKALAFPRIKTRRFNWPMPILLVEGSDAMDGMQQFHVLIIPSQNPLQTSTPPN